jgi:hypothetical protein
MGAPGLASMALAPPELDRTAHYRTQSALWATYPRAAALRFYVRDVAYACF